MYPLRCALPGVSFSTLSTGRFVLKRYICKGAESAEHAETAGYTYQGTPTTARFAGRRPPKSVEIYKCDMCDINTCVYMYIYIYIYIYRERERCYFIVLLYIYIYIYISASGQALVSNSTFG